MGEWTSGSRLFFHKLATEICIKMEKIGLSGKVRQI